MKINRLSVLMLTAALMLSASATACSNNDKQDITEESTTAQTTQAGESGDEEVTDDTAEAESLIAEESSELVDIGSGDSEQDLEGDPEEGNIAGGMAPDAIVGDPFFLHLEDNSDSGSVYVRVDYFLGDVQHGMMLVSHEPDENEVDLHFSEADFDFQGDEDLDDFRAEFYLGYYDGDPDEGILQAYSGEYVDQIPVGSIEMIPEFGEDYDLIVEADPSSESGYSVRLA